MRARQTEVGHRAGGAVLLRITSWVGIVTAGSMGEPHSRLNTIMLSAALTPKGTASNGISIPDEPQWHNFVDAWNGANITTVVKPPSRVSFCR